MDLSAAPASVFYRWQGSDLLLNILVQPKAGKDEIVGPQGDVLKVRIKAPPVDGEANQALVKFLSKTFKVPKSNIDIISGETSRHKRLRIHAPKLLPDGILAAEN
jgi:uncharacterized protein (TIGR00251 family)